MTGENDDAPIERALIAVAVKVAAVLVLLFCLFLALAVPATYGEMWPELRGFYRDRAMLHASLPTAALAFLSTGLAFWLCRQGKVYWAALPVFVCLPACIYIVGRWG